MRVPSRAALAAVASSHNSCTGRAPDHYVAFVVVVVLWVSLLVVFVFEVVLLVVEVVSSWMMASSSLASSSSSSSLPPDPGSSLALSSLSVSKSSSMERRRQTPNDFVFGRLIGEGSFSSVFLAKEVRSNREFAIKVCEQQHIVRERKQAYIMSEKQILVKISREWDPMVPFFVQIHSTFKDASRLYFVMTYAKNGDLLRFIEEMASKDIDCTQFYAAELLCAIQFLHRKRIIHRDLKPENILLNDRMHIMITDFGSAKLLDKDADAVEDEEGEGEPLPKRKSFVGTAQYVSPEILNSRMSGRASDLWALGCVLYQMVTGMPPFQSQSEYLIFQKIQKLEYSFHEGFDENAKDLIRRLLVIEPRDRLGSRDTEYYTSIRGHPFFTGIVFESLHLSTPPSIKEFMPKEYEPDPCWSANPKAKPGAERIGQLLIEESTCSEEALHSAIVLHRESSQSSLIAAVDNSRKKRHIADLSDEERSRLLKEQESNNKYHKFVEGNLILKQGILDKKKGLWARRRMFLLTEGPRLFYVDPTSLVLKGEIPWSSAVRPEIRDFKHFFVHTPNRIYYLIDPESTAKDWCHAIDEMKQYYFGDSNPKT